MGDDIYDEQLSYKIDNLIPKLNGLSMNKTGSDSDLKSRSGHTNGYVHHNDVKGSCSGSQIVFLNAAMYIEKLDASNPLINGDQGVVKSRDTEPSSGFILTNNNKIYQIHKTAAGHSNKKINGVIVNGAGDRLSLLETDNTKTGVSHGIECEKTKLSEASTSLSSSKTHVDKDLDKFSFDFCVSRSDENSSSDSSCKPNSKAVALLSKQSELEVCRYSASTDEAKNGKSPISSFTRANSDLNRSSVRKFTDRSSIAKCSSLETTRRYSTKLTDANYLNTFPEKSIHKKISSVLIEKSDKHSMNIEEKFTLPENWENLVGDGDLAWHRWYTSKTEQARKKKEVVEKEESRKKAEEEKQKDQMLRKQEIEERAILSWMEKKEKDRKAKLLDQTKKLETERLRKQIEQAKLQKMSQRAHVEWRRRKDKEQKEQMAQKEKLLHERDEEERLRSLKSKVAFEVWNENSKSKPKPMSVAIKDHKGSSDPSLVNLNWNPIPWKNILEEPNVNTKKNSRKKTLLKPFSS